MKEIPLSKGKVALVDDEDYERLSDRKWHTHKSGNNFYAKNRMSSPQYMHRQILRVTDPKIEVDHRDRNGLNNCRANLRLATHADNMRNATKRFDGKTSRFRGVSWDKQRKKFQAVIHVDSKRIFVGYFSSEEDAARAYDESAQRHFGDFANPNFCLVQKTLIAGKGKQQAAPNPEICHSKQ